MPLDVDVVRAAAAGGDHRAVRRLCLDAVGDGAGMAEVVGVLAGVQVEIGERWLAGSLTTAPGPAVVGQAQLRLAALELQLPTPPRERPVICVCAEGEWHAVASRMVALVFGAAGRDTVFLGPSLPAGELARFVTGAGPAAVALTCSSVAALPGAARSVAVLSAAGVPVVVGGHGFRAVPAAAEAFGAPCVDDIGAAVAAIDEFDPATVSTGLDTAGVAAVDVAHRALLERASQVLLSGRGLAGDEAAVIEEAVGYTLGFGRAAVLLRDRSVLPRHQPWLAEFLGGRSAAVPAGDVVAGVGCAIVEILSERKELHRLFVP